MSQSSNESSSATAGSQVEKHLAIHGKLSYVEIPAVDLQRSADFYEDVFGWTVERRGTEHVSFSDAPGDLIGHMVTTRPPTAEPGIVPYMYVDNVEDALARALARGGSVVQAPYKEGGLLIATLHDPAGNIIGMWQEQA